MSTTSQSENVSARARTHARSDDEHNASRECVPSIGWAKGKGSPYPIAERKVPELIPVLGSQSAGDVSHKPGGRLPLLSARPLRGLVSVSLPSELRYDGCEQFA